MTKVSNEERRRRNAILRLVRSAAAHVQYETDNAVFLAEHQNDCRCDLCSCFGQGACESYDGWSDEEKEAASSAV